ncbi:NlpC/P60 family protein [Labedaea rhizosphaerae]|uniref:NlpC/P60 family protein n=2 Tax=Labedaea rhizosphaerae TaxID=598644 RepID=A0A4R6S087_LABRH|nr:NlpC/P60 family protein [Labedaea rhizosphaerae]
MDTTRTGVGSGLVLGGEVVRKRPGLARGVPTMILVTVAMLGVAGTAVAVPPPPPNPSNSDISNSKAQARTKSAKVGKLTNQLAAAESRLEELQADVETKMEIANKALVDLQTAQTRAQQARRAAEQARKDAVVAGKRIETVRGDLDEFAAASYRQRSMVGSMSAYMGAKSPEDLLERSSLLNAVSSSQLDSLQLMQQAQVEKANKDSAARQALQVAQQKQREAEQAKRNADTATQAAVQARQQQAGENSRLVAAKKEYERQLDLAQAKVGSLQSQRQKYNNWLAAKRREDAANAQHASGGGGHHGHHGSAAGSGSARTVINRALGVLGTPYAWGGGNAYGPTLGIRDGGIADMYGDYNKVGFDCSGLMIYSFAAAGVYLPHYSGYQAYAGRRVPLSQMRPGDMLFWASGGVIHHVALYIGNGQMIEAPYSGSHVRIAPVRYGGIVPYATRVL